ncbi:diguanylate cyclase, partial [Burkholderia sp. SIMBA_052]
MDLFDTLQAQIDPVRLPLFAVTVTAAAQVNTPLIAILHWHGFKRATPLVL